MFDKDGNGEIEYDELVKLLHGDQVATVATKEMIENAIARVDKKGKGTVDFEDFKKMMSQCGD